jgi:Brp/Blh family beta-carotene 15,15'-monooxygenase
LALGGFLAIAVWHFGAEDREAHGLGDAPLRTLARGAGPIGLPMALWPDQVTQLFAWLAPNAAGAAPSVQLAGVVLVASFALGLAADLRSLPARRAQALALDSAAVTAAFVLLPPLVAFALYFALIHGPRHVVATHRRHVAPVPARRVRFYAEAGATALLALAAGAAAWFLWPASGGGSADLTRLVFIGLSVLTVPHLAFHAVAARAACSPA